MLQILSYKYQINNKKIGNFKTLATALTAANLVNTLKGPGPFTVFAPTDEVYSIIYNTNSLFYYNYYYYY